MLRTSSRLLSISAFAAVAASVPACSSKDKGTTAAPATAAAPAATTVEKGVTAASGDNLSIKGLLSLASGASLNLADATKPNKVLIWKLDDSGAALHKEVDVGADGSFDADVPRKGEIDLILSAKRADGTFDKAVLKLLFPDHAAEIDGMGDAEFEGVIADMKKKSERRGGHMAVLTSIDKSQGTKVEQADSMRFIGLPAKGGNMFVWPAKSAKGNLALGKISASGTDEAKSELAADSTSFDLDESAVAGLASAGKLLKSLKNVYINGSTYRAEPFFSFYSSDAMSGLNNAFGAPSSFVAKDAGYYIQVRQSPKVTFDELCNETKILYFVPPADVDTLQGARSPASPYNSKVMVRGTQNGKEICSGNETGLYLRKDSDDGRDLQMNWSQKGTSIASGWWNLKLDDEVIGTFDLGASNPVDSDGHAKVFVPKIKVNVNESGKVSSVSMIPTTWDATTSSYVELTDLRAFRQLTNELNFEIGYGSGSSLRASFDCGTSGNLCVADEQVASEGTGAKVLEANVDFSAVSNVTVYYKIGDVTLRFNYQPGM